MLSELIYKVKHNLVTGASYLYNFFYSIVPYSKGMIEYTKLNEYEHSRSLLLKNFLLTLKEEGKEIIDEICNFNLIGFIKELGDIWHSIVHFSVLTVLPKKLWLSKYTWYFIFILSLGIIPYKHGMRYERWNCIRNYKHCKTDDHVCNSKFKK